MGTSDTSAGSSVYGSVLCWMRLGTIEGSDGACRSSRTAPVELPQPVPEPGQSRQLGIPAEDFGGPSAAPPAAQHTSVGRTAPDDEEAAMRVPLRGTRTTSCRSRSSAISRARDRSAARIEHVCGDLSLVSRDIRCEPRFLCPNQYTKNPLFRTPCHGTVVSRRSCHGEDEHRARRPLDP